MATHLIKFKGLKHNIGSMGQMSNAYMQRMIVREHVDKSKNLHPEAKKRWNKVTQAPEPLLFPVHEMRTLRAAQNEQRVALGLKPIEFDLPEPVALDGESSGDTTNIEAEIRATYDLFRKRYSNFHLNEPLGPVEGVDLPFSVQRTHRNNLPVYTELKHGGNRKSTVIRCITGDIKAFKTELAKVVSNHEIKEKMGRVEVTGLHA